MELASCSQRGGERTPLWRGSRGSAVGTGFHCWGETLGAGMGSIPCSSGESLEPPMGSTSQSWRKRHRELGWGQHPIPKWGGSVGAGMRSITPSRRESLESQIGSTSHSWGDPWDGVNARLLGEIPRPAAPFMGKNRKAGAGQAPRCRGHPRSPRWSRQLTVGRTRSLGWGQHLPHGGSPERGGAGRSRRWCPG